jgi:hypothetical protein
MGKWANSVRLENLNTQLKKLETKYKKLLKSGKNS